MKKPIIAVDIDDVLADSTESLRLLVNKHYGVNLPRDQYLRPGPYWGYYEQVWQINGLGDKVSLKELNPMMEVDQSHVIPASRSSIALKKLAKGHDLIIITAREPSWEKATHSWVKTHYPDIFTDVFFAGNKYFPGHTTKGQLCREIGADWLIDDNVEHCMTAIDNNVKAILFGEYGWHQNVPQELKRCRNWQVVEEHFRGEA